MIKPTSVFATPVQIRPQPSLNAARLTFEGNKKQKSTAPSHKAYPAKPNRLILNGVRFVAVQGLKPIGFKVSVDPQMARTLHQLERKGKKLVIVPNHVSMLDFLALLEVGHKAKIRGTAMSAVEEFETNAFKAFLMQSMGMFSVDRLEGGDS